MSPKTFPTARLALVPAVACGLLLGACGTGDDDAASRPTVTLEAGATSYETLPPATSAPAVTEETEPEAEATGTTSDYTVVSGDYGLKVANQFGVSLQELENANGWSDAGREFPFPGSVIKIPAGATTPDTDTDDSTETATDQGSNDAAETEDTDETAGEAIPDPGDNCEAGSYTIEAGDTTRFAVANKFDVTVDAMDAANASTNGYSAFFPGLEIVIPAKDGC